MEQCCGTCAEGRRNGWRLIWCVMYGIVIHENHKGCRYHKEGNHETGRSGTGTGVA